MATDDRPLRYGWTTGACATASAKAAYQALLTGEFPDPVEVTLPRGQHPAFALATTSLGDGTATAGVVKDAGDDPDVTHGALILATVRRAARGSGVSFRAGEGVGTVTRPGLPIPPGEPAINPVPRQMLRDAIAEIAAAHGDAGDVEIEIAIPGGEALAAKTLNGRLGIVGGLSILGTTGIVVPYSCSAWIHSIHQRHRRRPRRGPYAYRRSDRFGIRGRRAETPRPSRNRADRHGRFRRRHAQISARAPRAARHHRRRRRQDDQARARPARPAFAARLGRSRRARASLPRRRGGSPELGARILASNTAAEAFATPEADGVPLGHAVARAGWETAAAVVAGKPIEIEIAVFDRDGRLVGHAPFAPAHAAPPLKRRR